jgi:hypothetical protein
MIASLLQRKLANADFGYQGSGGAAQQLVPPKR